VFFEIPLDQVFSGVFTDARSGERTPTGAVRRGLRPDPHRSRGAAESGHGQCSRPPRTGRSSSFGRSAATTGRRASRVTVAGVGSDRAGGHLRVASETEACWSVRPGTGRPAAGRVVRRSDRARSSPSGGGRVRHLRVGYGVPPPGALRCTRRGDPQRSGGRGAEGTGATPTGLSEVGSDWHQDRGLGQPGQREAVPRVRDRETGVESDTRHRPPRRTARRAM
jgi:hypothetical protein